MSTIAEKLEYLNETKSLIKDAIVNMGGTVYDTDTFRSYADAINALPNIDTEGAAREDSFIERSYSGEYTNGTAESIAGYAFYNNTCAWTDVTFSKAASIGNYAFYNNILTGIFCDYAATILDYAFYNNIYLTNASFEDAMIAGSYVFYKDVRLASINMPNVITLGDYAFYGCSALTAADFPSLVSLGTYSLYGCTALESVTLTSCTSIGNYALAAGTSSTACALTSINLPAATTIGSYAFAYNTSLTEVYMPVVTSIGSAAFRYCTGLTSIWIPSSCTTISASSYTTSPFNSCDSSLVIYCEATEVPDDWDDYWNYYGSSKKLTYYMGYSYDEYLAAIAETDSTTEEE